MIEDIAGRIEEVETNIIVNPTNAELAWEETTVNGDILSKLDAGYLFRAQELMKNREPLHTNELVVMKATGDLRADWVFNIYPPYYQPNKTPEYMRNQLIDTYDICLNEALKYINMDYPIRVKITFPLISSGAFMYPREWSYNALYTAYHGLTLNEKSLLNVKLVILK